MHIEYVESCPSTNALLAERAAADAPDGMCVVARRQTAGRGQRGNSWESLPYANLTFSLLVRPQALPAARQFELSMVVALGLADAVDAVLAAAGITEHCSLKWPNDLYFGDRKLAGILIENSLSGINIARSIVGIGLNVNQDRFFSDAPNPVSLKNITGREHDLDTLMEHVAATITAAIRQYRTAPDSHALLMRYKARMWRAKGTWPFREPDGEVFLSEIAEVGADGTLTLTNGRSYAFKQIVFVL